MGSLSTRSNPTSARLDHESLLIGKGMILIIQDDDDLIYTQSSLKLQFEGSFSV